MNDEMVTTTFVVDITTTCSYMAGLVTQHQGVRGITVDQKRFGTLIYDCTSIIVSSVLNYIVIRNRTTNATTAMDMQAAADTMVYGINSYGIGKEITYPVASDIVNRVERFWIQALANVLPDIDSDDVSINTFVIHPTGLVHIKMTYPKVYQDGASNN